MATDQSYVQYICEQAGLEREMSYRKMFGEYALYLEGKVVAFACGNQLFVKPTAEGRRLLGAVTELPFYPGGKPHLRLGEEIDDRELLKRLLLATAQALPLPRPKAKAKRQGPAKAP